MTLRVARIAAVLISLGTFGFLFVQDAWRADNLFLVPDLILCAALVAAAALPGRHAVPALVAAYSFTAGVFVTATASYAVDGRLGVITLVSAIGSVVLVAALVRDRAAGPA
ncbi:hypothetical protein AB0J86_10835 [Micromonospora sp. NPDC049559]|uniref:hypothetical protein n=1 Tax=Micromonospora sp. NPDC049559 TaxID=3155923 RepID=UPI003429DA31